MIIQVSKVKLGLTLLLLTFHLVILTLNFDDHTNSMFLASNKLNLNVIL